MIFFFFIWLLGASRYAQNTRTGSRNIFHTRPAHSQKLPKITFFNFSGLSTENLYMCPVSTLAGRFFSEKKGLSFKKPIDVCCKHPRGAFFLQKKRVSLQKTTYSRLERLLASKWPPPGIKTEHFHWKGVQKLRSLEHASGIRGIFRS